jgi:hypothetical protein
MTIFTDSDIGVAVDGLEWEETGSVDQSDDTLYWETLIDGEVQSSGSVSLADVGRELPTSIDAGSVKTSKKGRRSIEVRITVDSSTASTDTKVQAYGAGGKSHSFRLISENKTPNSYPCASLSYFSRNHPLDNRLASSRDHQHGGTLPL